MGGGAVVGLRGGSRGLDTEGDRAGINSPISRSNT